MEFSYWRNRPALFNQDWTSDRIGCMIFMFTFNLRKYMYYIYRVELDYLTNAIPFFPLNIYHYCCYILVLSFKYFFIQFYCLELWNKKLYFELKKKNKIAILWIQFFKKCWRFGFNKRRFVDFLQMFNVYENSYKTVFLNFNDRRNVRFKNCSRRTTLDYNVSIQICTNFTN